jgi:hypothetical protein
VATDTTDVVNVASQARREDSVVADRRVPLGRGVEGFRRGTKARVDESDSKRSDVTSRAPASVRLPKDAVVFIVVVVVVAVVVVVVVVGSVTTNTKNWRFF